MKFRPNQLHDLLINLNPVLDPNTYVFACVHTMPSIPLGDITCMFLEEEGITIILKQELANTYHLAYSETWAKITLQVHSSLNDVGLTAAVATQLGKSSVPCNVIAAYHHDHIFVPESMGDMALEVLKELT